MVLNLKESIMPKLHTKPKDLPPRKDLHVLVNEDSDDGSEKEDLAEEKSKDNPEEEIMFKLRESIAMLKGASRVAAKKTSGTSYNPDHEFKEGDKVKILTFGDGSGGRENLTATIQRVYPRAKTLQVLGFNGMSLWINFGEAVPEEFWV